MDTYRMKESLAAVLAVFLLILSGCKESALIEKAAPTVGADTTIGFLVEIVSVESIELEGYGIVGGLRRTGSSECEPRIRRYLEGYILKALPERTINIKDFINSHDTAVVVVRGRVPGTITKGQYFDVTVEALAGTQTTSLDGGWLYGAELKEARMFGISTKVLAEAAGPVYIDKIAGPVKNKKSGYILAGGTNQTEYRARLVLRRPDYKIASAIRNRLDERFGNGTARATSPSTVEVKVPWKYKKQKMRFFSIIRAMYLLRVPEAIDERIQTSMSRLVDSDDNATGEIALEAIGNECFARLTPLLGSDNAEIRLRAARCMLNLGSDQGLDTLREVAMDTRSPYRLEALEAIRRSAKRNDAATVLRRLLRDDEFDIRLAAYEELRKLDDIALRHRLVAGDFYLEQVLQTNHKAVFISRSGQPRVAIFGGPITCRDNIFIRSEDGTLTVNSSPGSDSVLIMRNHPTQPNVIVRLKSSFDLTDIIRTLCESPENKEHPGLAVSYSDMVAILSQMHEKGAIDSQFRVGSMPEISLNIK